MMYRYVSGLILGLAAFCAQAQVPVTGQADQQALLKSSDPKLAANKKAAYDFWREVLEGGHLDLADKYLAPSYIQHNPNVPTGLDGFKQFFGRFAKPQPIEPKIKRQMVSIIAEGNLVMMNFVQEYPDPADATKKYTTTWFDVFRFENGKIVEHWDSALKNPPRPQ
jgi:predicted SnoaL-like aldol condensation-catalyzing enzyme